MKDTESAASFQSLLASVSFHGPARVRRSPPQLLCPRVTRGRGRDCRILCRGRDCRSRPTRPPRRRVAAPSLWSCPSRRSRPRACKRIGRRAKPGPGPRHCNTPRKRSAFTMQMFGFYKARSASAASEPSDPRERGHEPTASSPRWGAPGGRRRFAPASSPATGRRAVGGGGALVWNPRLFFWLTGIVRN